MIVRAFFSAFCLFLAPAVWAQSFETATEAVANMRLGWNLGNSLESNSGDVNNMWIERWTQRRPSDYETAWGQPVTQPQLFALFKEAGFIRAGDSNFALDIEYR